jgi:hypothetical protein
VEHGVPESYEPHPSDSPLGVVQSGHDFARGEVARRLPVRIRAALIGGLILVLGVAGSSFLAAEWRSSVLASNTKSFESTAADASSALGSTLNTNIALTRALRARAAMGTQDGESGFLQWYQELQRGVPTPPDVVTTFIQRVPAAGLTAFRRQAEADPAFRSLVGSKFKVVPSGLLPDPGDRRQCRGGERLSRAPGLLRPGCWRCRVLAIFRPA